MPEIIVFTQEQVARYIQAERDRCAAICEAEAQRLASQQNAGVWCGHADTGAKVCASLIRAGAAPGVTVFDPALIAKATMTREEEDTVRRGCCPRCMERSLGDPTEGGGIQFRQCNRCTTVYAIGVNGTEAPRELLREGYEVMRALMRKSDASLDRNAEFAAVAAWWTKAQGGTPLMQPLEALTHGVTRPNGECS